MKTIAHIKTDFPTKFGLPRQSGMSDEIKGIIIFEQEYRIKEAFKGLEDFSHIWILWQFSEAVRDNWSPTVRPPMLGGNKRMGVFATRSPFRPNSIGLSCVKLDKIDYDAKDGPLIYVSGCDLMDNTPIYDIKPYLPYADSHSEATGGFTDTLSERSLKVNIKDELLCIIPEEKRQELIFSLSTDPRPSYQNDEAREYGFRFSEFEIGFKVKDKTLTVTRIEKKDK